ncbi:DMT family transporter [Priestia filamentosa]|uniref:Multidrug ABC transporter permease n=1 Tax=Priestia filamentosa TaxID=1402861 RepID=A0A1X7DA06_9BACI|nr:EamA family transporter [Priestia filamentosa]AKO93666.1 multidrug ABC transporter permease [Priestia filamentosa]MDT3763885.1 EamA family transporter [Priestia filamentosa]OXS71634.1 EamA family transporter [Priestia filamentosa]RJS67270.1 EamA family transporter [Priestia filamentosa]WCM14531.1 EamA family transporter [Priestia filamentosa]
MDTVLNQYEPKVKAKKVKKGLTLYIMATLIAVLFWSTSFVGTKIAYASFSPLTLGAARFMVAAIILGIIMLLKKDKTIPSLKDIGVMSLSGVLGTTLYFSMENIGVELTTASNAAIIIAAYPAITALIEFIFYKVKISWAKGIGILIALIGVYQISYNPHVAESGHALLGNVILVLAGFVFAFYNFTTRKVVKKYSMITISFYQTLAGAITFIPVAFIEKSSWKMPTMESFLVLLYLGIFCSVVAFLLYNYSLRKLSSSSAVTLMNLVPIFGVIFSVIVLHEVVRTAQIIGGIIVIFGVVLSMKESKSGKAKS